MICQVRRADVIQ